MSKRRIDRLFLFLIFFCLLFFSFFMVGENLFFMFFSIFESYLINLFFLGGFRVEGTHFFYFVYFLLFLSFFLGFVSYSRNILIFYLFFLGFILWFRGFFSIIRVVFPVEEGGLLSFFMFILAVLRTFVQPVTLSLRVFVNLFLGELLILFLSYNNRSFLFLAGFFEAFVIFLQTRVFTFLFLSYFKS